MMLLLHIFSGARLEAFLAFVLVLSIVYSHGARAILRRIPGLRPWAQKRDAERFALLKELDGNAYRLVLALVSRVTRDLLRWSTLSILVLTFYGIADFLQLELLADRRISSLTVLLIFIFPLFGIVLSILWIRQLVVDLTEFNSAKKMIEDERPSIGSSA